jgi:hypothetical protein
MAQQGILTENLSSLDDLAEFLSENQYYYTAKYELENKVIPLLEKILVRWPEISAMFINASRLIDLATHNTTMATTDLLTDFGYAENAWDKLDYGIAKYYLQKILDKEKVIMAEITEPPLLPLLSILVTLPALMRRKYGPS